MSACHAEDRGFKSRRNRFGAVAQLVEQRIEAPCVGSSTLSRAICGCSLVVKLQPSKLLSRVRFSSPAYREVVI